MPLISDFSNSLCMKRDYSNSAFCSISMLHRGLGADIGISVTIGPRWSTTSHKGAKTLLFLKEIMMSEFRIFLAILALLPATVRSDSVGVSVLNPTPGFNSAVEWHFQDTGREPVAVNWSPFGTADHWVFFVDSPDQPGLAPDIAIRMLNSTNVSPESVTARYAARLGEGREVVVSFIFTERFGLSEENVDVVNCKAAASIFVAILDLDEIGATERFSRCEAVFE